MSGLRAREHLPLWQRAVLLAFLVDIMFIYPAVNRVQDESIANRLLLLVLVAAVFLAFSRRWVANMCAAWDLGTALLMAYLLWIVVSTLASIAFGIQSAGSIMTYGLNSFAPIVLYGCFVGFPARRFLINAIIVCTALNILIGVVTFGALGLNVPIVSDALRALVFDPEAHRLVSLVGKSTVIGYLALFSFAWVLFFRTGPARYLLLVFFGVAVLLSFQRSMWAGLALALALYALSTRIGAARKLRDTAVVAGLSVLAVVTAAQLLDLSFVFKLVGDRIPELNLQTALVERENQQLIASEEFVEVLIGQGYGRYSPLNKEENLLNLPDAPYYMIFNETGLIGLSLFVGALLAFAARALNRGNTFQLWFVLHLMLVLLGSRVLWYFPLNFLILMLLAMIKDDRSDAAPLPAVQAVMSK